MKQTIQSILFKAKQDVYTHLNGANISRILGQGYDFSELREYDASDDIRHISWINSAKLGQPYVKKMHEEKELNVLVCSLLDGRFIVGDKLEVLTQTLALLAYASYEANDSFSSIVFNGDEFKVYESSKNLEQIERSILAVHGAMVSNKILNYSKVAEILFKQIEQKSLLFIIGDFLEPIDLSVVAQKHEVIVIMVRDEFEEQPLSAPHAQLIDPRGSVSISQTLSNKAVRYYMARRMEHDEALEKHFYAHNIKVTKIFHEDEIVKQLIGLFL